jgi:hypothetical protein
MGFDNFPFLTPVKKSVWEHEKDFPWQPIMICFQVRSCCTIFLHFIFQFVWFMWEFFTEHNLVTLSPFDQTLPWKWGVFKRLRQTFENVIFCDVFFGFVLLKMIFGLRRDGLFRITLHHRNEWMFVQQSFVRKFNFKGFWIFNKLKVF